MHRKLESLTIDEFWNLFLKLSPPPDTISPDHIESAKQFFVAGFGSMVKLAQRLTEENSERQQTVLAILEKQLPDALTLDT